MICQPCRDAADTHAPADQHCTSTGGPGAPCDCAHRTDRYRTTPETGACNATITGRDPGNPDRIIHCVGPAEHDAMDEPFHASLDGYWWTDTDEGSRPHATDPVTQCRAEFHQTNRPSGRCDRAAGHDGPHRDRSQGLGGLRWTEAVAVYPTDTTKD